MPINAFHQTAVFMVEIGLILVGAFYFIEVAQRTHLTDSLSQLVKQITEDRIAQGILVTFPLEFLIEGSSGFGTPVLIVAPVLRSLGFPLILCGALPFLNVVNAIPFGALGTPLRLGFPSLDLTMPALSHSVACVLLPNIFFTPFLTAFLIHRYDPMARQQQRNRLSLGAWILTLCSVYGLSQFILSIFGPEFPALGGAFITFVFALSTRSFFGPHQPIQDLRGIKVYGLLILLLWAGKQIWLDRHFEGTSIRIFNPGWVFIVLATVMLVMHRLPPREVLATTLIRSRRTLGVFFCMTWMVQLLKSTGALGWLNASLPRLITTAGAPLLGWSGSALIGTSTLSNLFFSPILETSSLPWLAAGSALGVPLAFQAITGARSVLKDEVTEQTLYSLVIPVSLISILLLCGIYFLTSICGMQ